MQLHQRDSSKSYDTQALQTADQTRARTLRDLLAEANVDIDSTSNNRAFEPEYEATEDYFNNKIAALEQQLIELGGKPNTQNLIDKINQEIQALYQRKKEELSSSGFSNLREVTEIQYPGPITLQEIQQQLDSKTLLLQYSLGKETSYLWVVSKTSLHTYHLPKAADLDPVINTFLRTLIDPRHRHPKNSQLTTAANALSQEILAPAAPHLDNKHLIIIPDGSLHRIPFAALQHPSAPSSDNSYEPLIENHDISYLPAAALIYKAHPNRKPAPKTLAILADPIFSPQDPRLTGKADKTTKLSPQDELARSGAARTFKMQRLPGTAKEAEAILKLIPNPKYQATLVSGTDSTYNWLTTSSLNQYRYIHLATHGIFNQERPELSSIILSLYNEQGQAQKRAWVRLL